MVTEEERAAVEEGSKRRRRRSSRNQGLQRWDLRGPQQNVAVLASSHYIINAA